MAEMKHIKAIRESSFGFLVQTLARDIDAKMKLALKEVDVDLKVFANLMLLLEEDGVNQRTLGKKLNFPEYFTSRNVDALVDVGYVERRPDPNSRRSLLVFLTDAGRQKATQLPAIVRKITDDALSGLTAAEQKQMIELMQKAVGSSSD